MNTKGETAVTQVTRQDVLTTLEKVERGETGVPDANLLRNWFERLEGKIRTYQLDSDEPLQDISL